MLNKHELYIIRSALHDVKQEGVYWGVKKHFDTHLLNALTKIEAMLTVLESIELDKKKEK